MANQITDNRTLVDAADSATPYDGLAGVAAGTLDTEIFIQGTGSIGQYLTNTLDGILYDAGSAQDWSNNVFYIWINCGIVGLLDTKANGGFRIRFCGATVTDFFEFYVGGSDSWPPTIEGGWAQFVVDIEGAPSNTGGTPPATTAIRYVGWAGITGGTMPRMADNTWIDEIRRLPDGSPGIIIEGRNGGTTDWNSDDIVTQLGSAVGTFVDGPGGSYVSRAPIQFGINDTTTHGFTDTNKVWLWDDQEFAPSDLYSLTALGNAGGTTNVVFGEKNGAGAAATGSQGLTIAAASGGVRWSMDFNDPNIDSADFYGCVFQHGGSFLFDDVAVEAISTLFIDVTEVTGTNSDALLKNSYINSNTAVDNGVLEWNETLDVDGIVDGSSFSKGPNSHHAIEFGTSVTVDQTLRSCSFNTFDSTNDTTGSTVQFLGTTGSLTLSLVGCTVDGSAATSSNFGVDDSAGITVTLSIDPTTQSFNVKDVNGSNLQNVRVFVETASSGVEMYQAGVDTLVQTAGTATCDTTLAHGLVTGDKVVIRGAQPDEYNKVATVTVTGSDTFTYSVDSGISSPATGTPVVSFVVVHGLTDASGNISASRTWGGNQDVRGWARLKNTSSPFYKDGDIAYTIDSTNGNSTNVVLQPDE